MPPEFLTTDEVAERIHVPVPTLRWWRHEGRGPRAFRVGSRKVLYKLSDLEAWLEERYEADEVYPTAEPLPTHEVMRARRLAREAAAEAEAEATTTDGVKAAGSRADAQATRAGRSPRPAAERAPSRATVAAS